MTRTKLVIFDFNNPSTQILAICIVIQLGVNLYLYANRNRALSHLVSKEYELKDKLKLLEESKAQLGHTEAKLKSKNDQLKEYQAIVDVDNRLLIRQSEVKEQQDELERLKGQYQQGKSIFDKLEEQISLYRDDLAMVEEGFYQPMFEFDTSDEYKSKLADIKEQQKHYIRSKNHIYSKTDWEVNGSKVEGRKNTNRLIKLTARAYNNEGDSAYGKVKWNNIHKLIERLDKVKDQINKDNEIQKIYINPAYHKLKIQELRIRYELMEKRQEEKKHQAELRRQAQEEARLNKDIEEAEKQEKQEKQSQKLLDKAKTQAKKESGEKLDSLTEKVKQLEADLAEAHEKNERAKSMAEQTKSGYIYVISNIGSFGKSVYKIGMTRRLEPMDRVKELGDASVPFTFDTHAMIYTDNAPSLEKNLHKIFNNKRVNLVNTRKEFFAVALEDIEQEVKRIKPEAEFITTIEAREYRETQVKRALLEKKEIAKEKKFPDSLEIP